MSQSITVPPTFSVVGLGKLGVSMAAAIASQGCCVIGVDINAETVEALNDGRAPVYETDLEQTIATNRPRIRATLDIREAILESDLTFVVVPTPSEQSGAFSLRYVSVAFRRIGKALAEKSAYHNVVLASTVLPGSTRYGLLPILEHESGKKVGTDIGLCYCPEFMALGSVMRDFLNPDFVLIGESDERAGAHLEECYRLIIGNHPPYVRMSFENAELTKIAVNTFVTVKITFANMLAELCEHIPGGDVDVVSNAVGLDKRIGRKYLTGGLSYGGPCFPRDNVAFGYIARALGCSADLLETTDQVNRVLVSKLFRRLDLNLTEKSVVAVLGLSFKPGSDSVDKSQGLEVARYVANLGAKVLVYDPLAHNNARAVLGNQVEFAESWRKCVAEADVIIVTSPDPTFRSLKASDLKKSSCNVVVLDCWRLLKNQLASVCGVTYMAVGLGDSGGTTTAQLESLWKPSDMNPTW